MGLKIEVYCLGCGEPVDRHDSCGLCEAANLFDDFIQAMPEVEFSIDREKNPREWEIVQECYGGDTRKYFLESWENFLEGV